MAAKDPPRPVNDNRGNHDRADDENAARPHDAGMRVETLDFPAQFLLWGMRCWLAAWRQGGHGQGAPGGSFGAYRGIAGEGFLRAGVPQAMSLIDDIFQAVALAALRPIDLRCVPCPYLSADEALLLGAVAASQRKQHGVAWAALLAVLPPAAARGALPSLISLAVLLRDAQLVLAPLDAEKCAAPELRFAMGQAGAAAPVH
jgi:hypothetical protein